MFELQFKSIALDRSAIAPMIGSSFTNENYIIYSPFRHVLYSMSPQPFLRAEIISSRTLITVWGWGYRHRVSPNLRLSTLSVYLNSNSTLLTT
jgi:hypothetical protein